MFGSIRFGVVVLLTVQFMLVCCRRNTVEQSVNKKSSWVRDSTSAHDSAEGHQHTFQVDRDSLNIYGDTVWVHSYGTYSWSDTVVFEAYEVLFSVWVDTNDYIVDTVKSSKGNRIVIGYNHYYTIQFKEEDKISFTVDLNKKTDLVHLIRKTDFWLESNLDVFQNLLYNKKYDRFVMLFTINSGYDHGILYYLVFDTGGTLDNIGLAGIRDEGILGGGPFITDDEELIVTSNEIYAFKKRQTQSLYSYINSAQIILGETCSECYKNLLGIRYLWNDLFLVLYERQNRKPVHNALILNTDTMLVDYFKYYGYNEETEGELLLCYEDSLQIVYLYDSERKALIQIGMNDSLLIREIGIDDMKEIKFDTMTAELYTLLDFEVFGTYRFYIPNADTTVFYVRNKYD